MNSSSIFGLQFLLSLLAWSLTLGLLLRPRLARLGRREALLLLTLPHAFRHVGMSFLVPGVVDQALPLDFAGPAAYGDLLAGLIALVTLLALHQRWPGALGLVWMLSIVGSLDLLNALRHTDVSALMGSTWYIPTFLVPLLLVTHFMSFRRLMTPDQEPAFCR